MQAHEKSAELLVPLKPKVKRQVPWENEEIVQMRKSLKDAHQRSQANPSDDNQHLVENAKAKLNEAYLTEQGNHI